MRRRVTYAVGGHFIALHKSMLFLFYLGVTGESFWSSLGLLRMHVDVLAALFDAQAAQIRVGVLFIFFMFLCSNRRIIFYAQAAYIRAIDDSLALRRPLVGLPWLTWAPLGSPVLFWARVGSPGLVWALLGSLGLV